MRLRTSTAAALVGAALFMTGRLGLAQDAPVAETPVAEKRETTRVELDEGALVVTVPKAWQRVKPRNRIIEVELAVRGEEEDKPATPVVVARMTMMAAGGTVEQNLARWAGQFRNVEPNEDGELGETEHREVATMKLHTLDIAGTYLDSLRGPFGPKVEKPEYRMLGAILETPRSGRYFFKLVGPGDVVEHNAEAFEAMLDSARQAAGE